MLEFEPAATRQAIRRNCASLLDKEEKHVNACDATSYEAKETTLRVNR
jgi:hypothetical protein